MSSCQHLDRLLMHRLLLNKSRLSFVLGTENIVVYAFTRQHRLPTLMANKSRQRKENPHTWSLYERMLSICGNRIAFSPCKETHSNTESAGRISFRLPRTHCLGVCYIFLVLVFISWCITITINKLVAIFRHLFVLKLNFLPWQGGKIKRVLQQTPSRHTSRCRISNFKRASSKNRRADRIGCQCKSVANPAP